MNIRRRHSNLTKTLKDYLVPIVALFLILILAYSLFSWDSNEEKLDNIGENITWAVLEFNSEDSEVYIEYTGGDKKLVENNTSLYKWEKVIVKNGSVSIDFPLVAKVNLDKMWILEYKEDGSFYLDSGSMWLEAKMVLDISMKYASISVEQAWVINLNQNEVQSTIYSLSWVAEVYNLAKQSTLLQSGQELSILVADASSSDVDLSNLKQEFSANFRSWDWYIRNGWDFYWNDLDLEETSTWDTLKGGTLWIINSYISFDNLTDESHVSSSSLDITWKYSSDTIAKISLNGANAKLNIEEKTFIFENVDLRDAVNDLVFKVYDSEDDILSKVIYTLYTNTASNSSNNWTSNFWTVTNFELDASKFVFTSPSTSWTFSTYDSQITIKWSVPAWVVSSVTVNWYKLWSFNWTTWRYHAWADYNNLKNGSNLYEVKYFDASSKLIYTNYFTIIKKSNTYSAEAEIDS